jgi:uncharacterized protein YecT (DUF1311 family)
MQMNSKLRVFLGTMAGLLVGIAGGYFLGQQMNLGGRAMESLSDDDEASDHEASDEIKFDGTQREMNEDGDLECQRSQEKMDSTLTELRSKVVGKDVASMQALQLLNDSQDAWQKSMEKLLAMYWPPQDDSRSYGSVFPMCLSMMKARLIEKRIEDLRAILDWEEGDVCIPAWPALQR